MTFNILHALFFCLAFSQYVESYKNPNDEILVGQRDRFWRHHSQEKTLILGDQDYYQSIEACLNKKLPDDFEEQLKRSDIIKPTVGNRLVDTQTGTIYLLQIENAFPEPYVNAVQTLASCIRENIPFLTEKRSLYKEFGLDDDPGLGGNNPTFVLPILSIFLPEVVEKMQNTLELAYESAGWVAISKKEEVVDCPRKRTHPHPSKVGMRTSEHLTYNGFPSLAEHDDGATAYTVNFSFSDPEDYEGGYFFITDYNEDRRFVKPNKYSCMVFLGGLYKHGVTEIKSGFREMFSTEYWPYPDAPLGNTLWNSIPESMEEYIRICNAQQDAQGEDFKYCTAKFPQVGEYSIIDERPIEKEPFFVVPKSLEPGEMVEILWRNDGEETTTVDGDAYVIGLPKQLLDEFHKYMDKAGIMHLAHEILYEDPLIDPSEQRLYTTKDNHKWGLMGTTWEDNDMIWLDPGNEACFESLITVLRNGDFDLVLDSVGKKFQLDGLMIQGIGIIFVSQFFGDSLHVDIPGSRGSFYNVVVPLYLPPNNPAKILVGDGDADLNPENAAPITLEYDVGLVLGGDTVHGTCPCDYRQDNQFRLSVAIYLADINEDNVDLIASDATSLFPTQHDEKWFFSQRGRFWSASDKRKSLKNDTGRRSYDVQDLFDQCQADKHLCETDLKGMRLDCPRTCEVYMEEDSYRSLFESNLNTNSTEQDVCELEPVKENTEKSL